MTFLVDSFVTADKFYTRYTIFQYGVRLSLTLDSSQDKDSTDLLRPDLRQRLI
jgi:hypothetical protein